MPGPTYTVHDKVKMQRDRRDEMGTCGECEYFGEIIDDDGYAACTSHPEAEPELYAHKDDKECLARTAQRKGDERLKKATEFINGLESYPCLRDVGKCTEGEVLGELCPSCAARKLGPELED